MLINQLQTYAKMVRDRLDEDEIVVERPVVVAKPILVERTTIQSGQLASLAYLVNPTARDLLGLMQAGMRERNLNYGEFRALVARDGTVYAWDAHKGAHYGCWKDLIQQGCDMGNQDEVACILMTWIPEVFRGRVARANRTTPVGPLMRGMAYTLKHKHLVIDSIPSETWQMAYRGLQRLARAEEKRIETEVGAPINESKPQWATPAFKAWFGNSVVRDAKGNPRIVYHGTYGDFNAFDHNEVAYRGGILAFFSTGPKFASNYANTMSRNNEPIGGTVMPCYLRIEHPFDFRTRWDIASQFFDENGGVPDDHQARLILRELKWGPFKDPHYDGYGNDAPGSDALTGDLFVKAVRKGCWTALEYPDFVEWLKQEGFDGLIMKEARSINYAVFEPNQIKSAVGNAGSFNAGSDSIIESRWNGREYVDDDDQQDDEYAEYKPETTILKAGMILYHGTQSPDFTTNLDFPAWVSNHPAVAQTFVGWHGVSANPKPRVMQYKLDYDVTVILFRTANDMEQFKASRGYEDEPMDPTELAQLVCSAGYGGWIIPDNYPQGADIMLCHPCLTHIKTKRVPMRETSSVSRNDLIVTGA